MPNALQAYIDNMTQPHWSLFYRMVTAQLSFVTGCRVLDFGSGLGITASGLAKGNEVVAIEPNPELVEARRLDNSYWQIIGGIDELRQQPDNAFDAVLCHNVLEYAGDQKEIFRELCRVAKPGGVISLIKHNHAGRVLQCVLQNSLDEAASLLDGGTVNVVFGRVRYYDLSDIKAWIGALDVQVDKVLGIRTFWGLQPDVDIRRDPVWQDRIFDIEMKVSEAPEYVNISFFNHVLLRKRS
jgi:SAM-dependent methyltransferase